MNTQNKTNKTKKTNEFTDDGLKAAKFQHDLKKTIQIALDIEQAFKMMSYRIIDQETYIKRITEILEFANKQ